MGAGVSLPPAETEPVLPLLQFVSGLPARLLDPSCARATTLVALTLCSQLVAHYFGRSRLLHLPVRLPQNQNAFTFLLSATYFSMGNPHVGSWHVVEVHRCLGEAEGGLPSPSWSQKRSRTWPPVWHCVSWSGKAMRRRCCSAVRTRSASHS